MSGECNRQAAPWHLRIMNDILSAHITIDTAGMEISHTHRNPAKNALSFPFAMHVVVSVIVVELRAYVCYTIHRCTWTAWLPFFFIRCVPFQTITSAMNTLTPPVALEDPANQSKVDYILEVSSATDFDYPPVSHSQPICSACRVYLLNVIR